MMTLDPSWDADTILGSVAGLSWDLMPARVPTASNADEGDVHVGGGHDGVGGREGR